MIMDAGLSGIQTPALLCDKRRRRQIHKMKRSLLDSCGKGMGDLMSHIPVPDNYVTEICARSFEEAAQYTIDLLDRKSVV